MTEIVIPVETTIMIWLKCVNLNKLQIIYDTRQDVVPLRKISQEYLNEKCRLTPESFRSEIFAFTPHESLSATQAVFTEAILIFNLIFVGLSVSEKKHREKGAMPGLLTGLWVGLAIMAAVGIGKWWTIFVINKLMISKKIIWCEGDIHRGFHQSECRPWACYSCEQL